MGKWKKKLGKFANKAIPVIGLGLGAAALAKRRKAKALNAITAGDIVDTGPLSGKIGYEGDFSSAAPGANKAWKIKNSLAHKNWNKLITSGVDTDYVAPSTERYSNPGMGLEGWAAKKGGRAGHKSGGRVGCGKAKRGFGRALKKK